jgi:hypothetical protein
MGAPGGEEKTPDGPLIMDSVPGATSVCGLLGGDVADVEAARGWEFWVSLSTELGGDSRGGGGESATT